MLQLGYTCTLCNITCITCLTGGDTGCITCKPEYANLNLTTRKCDCATT